jgi:predicted aspartyl protease
MNFPFDPGEGLIIAEARLWGPNGSDAFLFGLDTGATETVVSVDNLAFLGYSLSNSERANVFTASAIEFAPRVRVQRIGALGHERSDFPVLAYNLPAEIGVDGMLGLDFLRGLRLTVDFREGQLSLE